MATKFKPRRVRDESERTAFSSDYIQLSEGEKFVGYPLFQGDPKVDEPGYYEFFEHYDPGLGKRGGSVPCGGEDCPYCSDGEKPRTRAKTLWWVTQDQNGKLKKPELRIFNLNGKVIKMFTEMRGEGDKFTGRLFRVSCVSDKGDYSLMPKDDKLKKAEVSEILKADNVPDFDKMITAQGERIMQRINVQRALEDDDDDDDATEETTKARKGSEKKSKGKGKAAPEPDDDDDAAEAEGEELPDEAEGLTVIISEVDEENFLLVDYGDSDNEKVWGTSEIDVTEFDEGDTITISYVTDDDDDKVLTEEPELVEDEDGDDEKTKDDDDDSLPDEIEDETFVVKNVDASESIIEVENDELGLEFTLYFLDQGPASDVDFDDYEDGMKITVSAEKDTQGDMVATAIPKPVKAKGEKKKSKGKGSAKKKGGKGK